MDKSIIKSRLPETMLATGKAARDLKDYGFPHNTAYRLFNGATDISLETALKVIEFVNSIHPLMKRTMSDIFYYE